MRLALILCLAAAPALAQDLDDRHLPVIPRTDKDKAKRSIMAATPQQRPRQRVATPTAGRVDGLERGAHGSHRDRAVARLSLARHKPVDDAECGAGATPAAPRYGTVATSAASTPRRPRSTASASQPKVGASCSRATCAPLMMRMPGRPFLMRRAFSAAIQSRIIGKA